MRRIAILGSDSTHTEAYGDVIRTAAFRSEMCFDSIWGDDATATSAKAAGLGIPRACRTMEEAIAGVDAVFVLSRFTDDRVRPARLAIRAGLPVFIDKRIAEEPLEADEIVREAAEAGVPLIAGSPYRFAGPVVHAKNLVASGAYAFGLLVGARECLDLGPDPRFQRLGFYGIHAAEMIAEIYGDDLHPKAIASTPRATIAVCERRTGEVCTVSLLSGMPGEAYRLTLAGSGGHHDVEFGYTVPDLYPDALRAIADQLFSGKQRVAPSSHLAALRLVALMEGAA